MAALTGLQPVTGWTEQHPEATAEQRLGGPANPAHARPEWASPEPMPWELTAWAMTPASPVIDPGLPGAAEPPVLPAGIGTIGTPYYDATPYGTHAAPWPKGVETSVGPDATARQLEQSRAIHADGMGAAKVKMRQIDALNDTWEQVWNPGAESSTLQQHVPQQVAMSVGGGGSTDRASNPAGVNEFDFQNAHLQRRWATGSIPGNYMWMRPGGRPMVHTVLGPARPPTGAVSPFTGQDLAASYGTQGAVLTTPAAGYSPPPQPYTAPPLPQQAAAEPGPVMLW